MSHETELTTKDQLGAVERAPTRSPFDPHLKTAAPQDEASSPLFRHFNALDGMRGLAILMVLAYHSGEILQDQGWEHFVRLIVMPGYQGVTLFFVLSGFLITRILIRTCDQPGYFETFYLRRSRRIFPLYFTYLAVMIFMYYPYAFRQLGKTYQIDAHYLWYVFYANNIWWLHLPDSGLAHLWSLAIEEQFYLVWPFIIYLVPRRWILWICGLGIIGSLACRIGMVWTDCLMSNIYVQTPSRLDALLLGSAIGMIELQEGARLRLMRALPGMLCLSLLGTLILAGIFGIRSDRALASITVWPFLTWFFAGLIFWAATTGANNRLFNAWWLRGLGKYSYGIYMLQVLPMMIVPRHLPTITPIQRVLAIVASLVFIAVMVGLSWHFLEYPFLRMNKIEKVNRSKLANARLAEATGSAG